MLRLAIGLSAFAAILTAAEVAPSPAPEPTTPAAACDSGRVPASLSPEDAAKFCGWTVRARSEDTAAEPAAPKLKKKRKDSRPLMNNPIIRIPRRF